MDGNQHLKRLFVITNIWHVFVRSMFLTDISFEMPFERQQNNLCLLLFVVHWPLWASIGRLLAALAEFLATLEPLLAALGPLLGRSWLLLGCSWAALRPLLAARRRLLVALGALLERQHRC